MKVWVCYPDDPYGDTWVNNEPQHVFEKKENADKWKANGRYRSVTEMDIEDLPVALPTVRQRIRDWIRDNQEEFYGDHWKVL